VRPPPDQPTPAAALVARLGLGRAELVGISIALVGGLLATLVALRHPLGLVAGPGPGGPVPSVVAAVDGQSDAEPPGPALDGTRAADVVVHVAGEVAVPGVVVLPVGARVVDALAGAGGATSEAALDGINLARELVDGEQVVVPTRGAPGVADPPAAAAPTAYLPDGRLDLNAATAADLEALPGVGEVTAARILAWREASGPFGDPVELREVRGIGEATWLDLRDLVAVR
jgi:competence protein ComEA